MHFELSKLMVYELNYILSSRSGKTGVLCCISCCHVYMSVFRRPIFVGGFTKGIAKDGMLWMEGIGHLQPEICSLP